jgi:DnaJ-class molecular chaperone
MGKVVNSVREMLSDTTKRMIYDHGGDMEDVEMLQYCQEHPQEIPAPFGSDL